MKNNIAFFTHDTDAYDHRKFIILRAFYGAEKGWAMEGRFWALNCIIGLSSECKLDLNLKGEKAKVARELELSMAEIDEFIRVLTEEAELIHNDSGVIWTDQTQEDLRRAMTARSGAKSRRNGGVCGPSHDELKTSHDELKTSADRRTTKTTEQSRAERSRAEQQAKGKQPVDNSAPPDDGFDDDGFGDLPALPAAALSMSAERVKTALASTQAKLAVRDLDAIALRLSAHGLDESFIAWAVKKSTDRTIRNPGAFLRSGLLGSGEFASWPEEYRLETRKPEAMRRAQAPEICPHCGDPLRKTTDRAGCTCGAMWEYDPGRDEWAEQSLEDVAG